MSDRPDVDVREIGESWSAFDPTRFDGDESFEIVEGMDIE